MSKITNELREHIAKRESTNKFTPVLDDLRLKLKLEIQNQLKKIMPKIEVPQELIDSHYVKTQTMVLLDTLGVEKEIHDFIKYSPESVQIRQVSIDDVYVVKYAHTLSILVDGKILEIVKKYRDTTKERASLRSDLLTVLSSVKTNKQGRELIPELAKYFEEKNTGSELIPIALINNVRKQLAQKQLH